MADVELVIKVPEELYEAYKGRPPMLGDAGMDMLAQSIANGTPLPKGHGDIVDIEHLIDMFWDGNSMEISKYDLSVIEPIIEADRAEETEEELCK